MMLLNCGEAASDRQGHHSPQAPRSFTLKSTSTTSSRKRALEEPTTPPSNRSRHYMDLFRPSRLLARCRPSQVTALLALATSFPSLNYLPKIPLTVDADSCSSWTQTIGYPLSIYCCVDFPCTLTGRFVKRQCILPDPFTVRLVRRLVNTRKTRPGACDVFLIIRSAIYNSRTVHRDLST